MTTQRNTDQERVKKRRQRAHSRGDHSLCVPGTCDEARVTVPAIPSQGVEAAVLAYVDDLPLTELDGPVEVLCRVAVRLARELDGNPVALPALARELQTVLTHIAVAAALGEDEVTQLQANRAARRVRLVGAGNQ